MTNEDVKKICRQIVLTLRSECDTKMVDTTDNLKTYAESEVSTHSKSNTAHTDIRTSITELADRLNALADSDDITLDQMSELVAYIKSNRSLIDSITTAKISVSDIIDALDSSATNKPLSANQGKALNEKIEGKVTKVEGKTLSANDYTDEDKAKLASISAGAEANVQADWNAADTTAANYIKNKPTSLPASDVPDWAKSETKPTYTKDEVGLGNVPNVSTNEQTPTFTRASSRANIVSGESISKMLGKISKFFYDLKNVAFTGKFTDLSEYPYLPKKRNFKQETYVFNMWGGRRYVKIATIVPTTSDSYTNIGIGLRLRYLDYEYYSMVETHFGFACFQNDSWVDWCGFTKLSEHNISTSVANGSSGSSKLIPKLVLLRDPVDPYCLELWIKLDNYDRIHIELMYYSESHMTYSNSTVTGIESWGNANGYECQQMEFINGEDLVYLDHIPTENDSQYGVAYDYPTIQLGSWS